MDEDNQLKLMEQYCIQDWPEAKKKVALSEWKGIVLLGNKIVVPREIWLGLLKQAHEGHMGIKKTKLRARQLYYWADLSAEVEEFVKRCSIRLNSKEPLHPWPIASRQWERVATDIITYWGVSYLVVIDAYYNWLEIIGI
ncbi:hypothetical protein PR048_028568 [Dryococelus australis]|uniref:RNA-directed DNA polymerase n=1 Tax=Dryococelus australis TaxID=614101 RepID=A0ABQ9GDH2_9NEOP|nr:hypothetical protein PR048_028568 [Dryococelus australis]